MLADKKKEHGHINNKIKRLYFAVPKDLEQIALKEIPKRAGLLVVHVDKRTRSGFEVDLVRSPETNKKALQLKEYEVIKLYRLAAMRIWRLKKALQLKKNP